MYSMCAVWCQERVGWYKGALPLHKRKSEPPGCPRFADLVSPLYLSTPENAIVFRIRYRLVRGSR
jgi:hypothetical protein